MESSAEYFRGGCDLDLLILDITGCSGKGITGDYVKEFAKLLYPPHNWWRMVAVCKEWSSQLWVGRRFDHEEAVHGGCV
jgi:hypothetical protein